MLMNELVVKERMAERLREADAERLVRPLVEARARERRARVRARLGSVVSVFASRRRRVSAPVPQR